MTSNPDLFVHVSLPSGIHRVPRVTAERAGWPIPGEPKRARKRTPKPRVKLGAATPTPDPETVSGDDTKESA